MLNEDLQTLANQVLETLEKEDKEYDFRNGGMYREKKKAKYYKST